MLTATGRQAGAASGCESARGRGSQAEPRWRQAGAKPARSGRSLSPDSWTRGSSGGSVMEGYAKATLGTASSGPARPDIKEGGFNFCVLCMHCALDATTENSTFLVSNLPISHHSKIKSINSSLKKIKKYLNFFLDKIYRL